MAIVGDRLLQPESGWQRIDSNDTDFSFQGDWIKQNVNVYYNNTSYHTTGDNQEVSFVFYGTKLRTIGNCYNLCSSASKIEVDGVTYPLTQYNENISDSQSQQRITFEIKDLEENFHFVRLIGIKDSRTITLTLDAIDIDEDGYMSTKEEYEESLQQSKNNFPVLVGDETVTTEDDVLSYAETLTHGEKQLLVSDKLNGIYLTDGQGGYTKLNTGSDDNHDNKDVLDLLSTDGKDLFFNGKNVQSIKVGDNQAHSGTFLNVVSGQVCTVNIDNGSNLCEQIVQAWEFEEGLDDLITVLKTFNNAEKDNFYYNSNEIEFTNSECKVKDKYIFNSNLNSDGFYESKIINKDDFIEIVGLEVL